MPKCLGCGKIMEETHRLYCTTCEALGRDDDPQAYEPYDPWDQPGADEYYDMPDDEDPGPPESWDDVLDPQDYP